MRAARNLLFSPCSGRRHRRRPEHGERYSWVYALAHQPDSPTARGGGGPEHVPKWRCPTNPALPVLGTKRRVPADPVNLSF